MLKYNELKQLAIDCVDGKVFTSNNIDNNKLSDIFFNIKLMTKKEKEEFLKNKPVLLYEYMDKAIPIKWNKHPIFVTFNCLVEYELIELNLQIEELRKRRKHNDARRRRNSSMDL